MCAVQKKKMMNLPLKVVLTEAGASEFIRQKKKMQRLKLADDSEKYGISFTEFNPSSLQQMILLNYVSKMEVSMPEFSASRQEIMDVSKIFVYSVLYKQFDSDVQKDVLNTDCVAKYNRSNMTNVITEKNRPSDASLRAKLLGKDAFISQIREIILKPVWDSIVTNKDLTNEEKNVQLLMSEKYINRLGIFNWYLFIKFFKSPGFDEILSVVRKNLNEYMNKSCLAEYIALMIMELAQNSENENLKEVARVVYHGLGDVDGLICDLEIREKLIQELVKKNNLVYISWGVGGGSLSIGAQGKIQITVYNKSEEFKSMKNNLEEKRSADLGKKTLIDFYKETSENIGDTTLGLYYLSYLDEACKKHNVRFESIVNQYKNDLNVVNLIFYF